MDDPLVTLLDLLKTGWSLADPLSDTDIRFATGEYDQAATRPMVVISEVDTRNTPLTATEVECFGIYAVEAYVKVDKTTAKGAGVAKAQRWSMRAEILRILNDNSDTISDIDSMELNQNGQPIEDLEGNPEVLTWRQLVTLIYRIEVTPPS
jgi:hypothetical protein